MTWFRPRELGQAGMLRVIRDDARNLVIAMYANPIVGTWQLVVPLANRLIAPANDDRFDDV